jgi:hypothetical protein
VSGLVYVPRKKNAVVEKKSATKKAGSPHQRGLPET